MMIGPDVRSANGRLIARPGQMDRAIKGKGMVAMAGVGQIELAQHCTNQAPKLHHRQQPTKLSKLHSTQKQTHCSGAAAQSAVQSLIKIPKPEQLRVGPSNLIY